MPPFFVPCLGVGWSADVREFKEFREFRENRENREFREGG